MTTAFHPLADAFPLLAEDSTEFAELVRDIKENGLLQPIVMYEGKILDGRNRARAFDAINEGRAPAEKVPHTEIKFETKYPDGDPASYVWSINVVRRQLTPSQRDMAAQKLEELGWGRPKKVPEGSEKPKTRKQIAAKTGASAKGMDRAARVRREGTPEVVKAVEDGKIPLHTAEKIAVLSEADQDEIMADPKPAEAVVRKATTAARKVPSKRKGPGPSYQMRDHMTGHQSGIRDVQLIGKFWEENKALIKDLNPEELRSFIKDLEESRAATSRLLHVIEEEILPVWELPGKKPSILSTALNKIDASRSVQSTWPEDTEGAAPAAVSGTLSPEAAKTLERTVPAAKAPTAPRTRKTAPKAADKEGNKGS